MLNAVERTVGSYAEEEAKTQRDLEIAQGQLRDYETRLGTRFAHTDYLEALAELRDHLEAALSSPTEALDTESIVADIHALKAAHTIEAVPERTARKAASIEEAVRRASCIGRQQPRRCNRSLSSRKPSRSRWRFPQRRRRLIGRRKWWCSNGQCRR